MLLKYLKEKNSHIKLKTSFIFNLMFHLYDNFLANFFNCI
jgi:hypothetical protein